MNLHEYQAKALLRAAGIKTPRGIIIKNSVEAKEAAQQLGGNRWVVKAQIHSGGRGKAGGIKTAQTLDEVHHISAAMLGSRLKTEQSSADGLPINEVLIEEECRAIATYYLALTLDRPRQQIVFIASTACGTEIETVAETNPEAIIYAGVNPAIGFSPYLSARVGGALQLDKSYQLPLTKLMNRLYQLFIDNDLTLLELNPLIITEDHEFLPLDAKISIDDNALFRHQELVDLRDTTQEDHRETQAQELQLNYVPLDGTIGCIANGAGLAMATMDIIKLYGGEPANFLDVGGDATSERVKQAFKLILTSTRIKSILVNIFGGIVRCDLIADGIIQAAKEIDLKIPVIVRLQGNNVDLGRKMLDECPLNLQAADDLIDAAQKAIAAAQ